MNRYLQRLVARAEARADTVAGANATPKPRAIDRLQDPFENEGSPIELAIPAAISNHNPTEQGSVFEKEGAASVPVIVPRPETREFATTRGERERKVSTGFEPVQESELQPESRTQTIYKDRFVADEKDDKGPLGILPQLTPTAKGLQATSLFSFPPGREVMRRDPEAVFEERATEQDSRPRPEPKESKAPELVPPPVVIREIRESGKTEQPSMVLAPAPGTVEPPELLPEKPRLIIGQLRVDVLPPPPPPSSREIVRVVQARNPASGHSGEDGSTSRLRFGLGQI
jgi:hypothetical protein